MTIGWQSKMRLLIQGSERSKVNHLLTSIAAIVLLWSGTAAMNATLPCLPDGIKPTDVVSTVPIRTTGGGREIRTITVGQTLKQLKARCRRNNLVDGLGTKIRFYKLTGCWGTVMPDERETRERQKSELAALKKRYRVIELTCNPSGEQIPRSPQ